MSVSMEAVSCNDRRAGLIAPDQIERFATSPLEQEVYDLFDWLCAQAGDGNAYLHGERLRVSRRIENGTEVRSVVRQVGMDDQGLEIWQAISSLMLSNGTTCAETHIDREENGSVIWEPAVGSEEVKPITHQDRVLFYRVAYEANPLPIRP